MSQLFTPFALGKLELANRIVVAPMCQYSADNGSASDWHMIHLGQLGLSGAGLLIIEATAVTPEGRITPGDLGLWSNANEAALAHVLQAIRRYSSIPVAIQLAHAGRKASTTAPWDGGGVIPPDAPGGWRTQAPSALPFNPGEPEPEALDAAGLAGIREAFVASTGRAARLGLDAIELHCAHGYLLHEFLSPLSNARKDAYGGALQNRMRYPLEVFEAVRRAFPAERPVGVRISASDWVEGGWDVEQSIAFARELEARGCAYIHVSSGGLSPAQQIPIGPDYQVPLAERIRAAVKLPVIAVGLVTEPLQAEEIIFNGRADLVALARGMLFDPRWPWHAAAELGAQVDVAPQYWRSPPHRYRDLFSKKIPGRS